MTVEVVAVVRLWRLMMAVRSHSWCSMLMVMGSVVAVARLWRFVLMVVVAHLWRFVLMVVVVAHLWRLVVGSAVVMVFPKKLVVGSVA